ncbi:hypothetical protein KY329_03170 [Candidatus Woesearchaeota archaeon]|nr:hypothetical protein [Candidatus Woesearchaeota archaeon]
MDKELKQALKKSKGLERPQPLSRADIVRLHEDTLQQAEDLRELLKPTWFVLGPSGKRKVYKSGSVQKPRR